MRTKIFNFSKNNKTPDNIEKEINEFLADKRNFKFATQSDSNSRGRFYLTLFYEGVQKAADSCGVKAKVFRGCSHKALEEQINKFLANPNVSMRIATQSSGTSNNIFVTLFYAPRKVDGKKEK